MSAKQVRRPPRMKPIMILPPLIALASVLSGLFSWGRADAEERVVPTPVVPRTFSSSLISGKAAFVVDERDKRIRYNWTPASDGGGLVSVISGDASAAPIVARYQPRWRASSRLTSSRIVKDADVVTLTQVFVIGDQEATLQVHGHIEGGSLVLDMEIDKPLLSGWTGTMQEDADVGRFSLPFSPTDVFHSIASDIYASLFIDWTVSDSTRIEGADTAYLPRTDGTFNSGRERLIFTASPQIADVMPNSAWPQSRYYDRMTGRLVLDVTVTEHFADIERKLVGLRNTGLSRCLVVVHVWQQMGYDNGLPTVLPANSFLGGGDIIKRIAALTRSMDCFFALHQNYIDHYTNSGVFDSKLISLDGRAMPINGWFNQGLGSQSYSAKPRAFTLFARQIAANIHRSLGTTAAFIDVNSSFLPWERVDMDAREPNGGMFRPFSTESNALFALLQDIEQGPVLGEGSQSSFYWAGALDGVDGNSGVSARIDSRVMPLWVDFNLRKIHPIQQNYGMGFYSRYRPGQLAIAQPDQDIYRTQQIAFGHLPYRSGSDWGDPRRFVQEAALAAPVAHRYGGIAVSNIAYRLADRWIPIETALPVNASRTVRVRYANGLVITANTAAASITDAAGTSLPTGGWSAHGPGIDGASSSVNGTRRDFMRTADAIYADPREAPGNWAGRGDPAPTDFGVLRTSGQSWIRCLAGKWTFLGFAERGFVDLDMSSATIAMPARLAATGEELTPQSTKSGFWHVRLTSGRRYTSSIPCAAPRR